MKVDHLSLFSVCFSEIRKETKLRQNNYLTEQCVDQIMANKATQRVGQQINNRTMHWKKE